jgi:hypothetical protein
MQLTVARTSCLVIFMAVRNVSEASSSKATSVSRTFVISMSRIISCVGFVSTDTS